MIGLLGPPVGQGNPLFRAPPPTSALSGSRGKWLQKRECTLLLRPSAYKIYESICKSLPQMVPQKEN